MKPENILIGICPSHPLQVQKWLRRGQPRLRGVQGLRPKN